MYCEDLDMKEIQKGRDICRHTTNIFFAVS